MNTYHNFRSKQLHITPMLVGIAFFMQTLDGSILNTALPTIAKAFGQDPLQAQSLIFAYVITVGIFLPLSGYIFERYGSLKTLTISAVIFTVGSFLCSTAQTFDELIMYRILQGIGGGLIVPAGRLEVLKLYPKRMLMPLLNFVMIPGLLGTAAGPALGGFIVEYFSWYWIFLVNIPIGIIYIMLCYSWLPNLKETKQKTFDTMGFLIFVLFSLIISIAVTDSESIKISSADRIIFMVISILLLFTYYFYARTKTSPLFDINMFKIKEFTIGIIGNVFSRLSGGAMPFLVPLMLQVCLDYSPFETGLIMLFMGIMIVIGKLFAPFLIRTIGYRRYLMITTIALTAVTIFFAMINKNTPEYMIYILISALGILNSLQFSALTGLTLIDLPEEHLNGGNGLLSVVMQIAYSIGIGIGGFSIAIFGNYLGLSTSNYLQAFYYTYFVIAGFTFIPIISYCFLNKKQSVKA